MSEQTVEWKCPKCQIGSDSCRTATQKMQQLCIRPKMCMGFICDCDTMTSAGHGDHIGNPCTNAICYHCGWGGTFPQKPKKMPAWAKQAAKAGWRPPEGWTP